MLSIRSIIIKLFFVFPLAVSAQSNMQVLSLDTILQRIDQNNLSLKFYDTRAQAYKYSADAATAWMAPMVGVGTFQTPYPFQMIMEDRDKGMLMLRVEQDIPNRAKKKATQKYIQSQGDVERAGRDVALNDLRTLAKRNYYTWLIAAQKISVLNKATEIMETMKKIEEVRYPYNQSRLSNVFQADARIEQNKNMIRMQEGEISRARAILNGLMNRQGNVLFSIDTSLSPTFNPVLHDTSYLSSARKDIVRMNESIRSMQLNIEAMKLQRKPEFKVQFDHMYPLSPMMPNAFSAMAMVSIPIAPWASKMYKSEVKAMQFNTQAMQQEKEAMLQETQGMLYGMQYEIQSMQRRIEGMEKKIIPALHRALDVNMLNYKENKLPVTTVISDWEALNMMQTDLLDEKLKLYQMIVDYEKEIYR